MTSRDPSGDIPYTSLAAVRAAHLDLLKQYREAGGNKGDVVPPPLVDATEAFVRDARLTGALLDREADQREVQGILDAWVTRLYRSGKDPGDVTLAEFDSSRAPELPDEACPYVGLDTFTGTRADVFFGRQSLVDELVAKLKDLQLLAVVGPSGSGKSSLVLAGVLPRLMRGAIQGSQDWKYYDRIVPGSDPLRNLACLFVTDTGRSEQDISQALRRNPSELKSLLELSHAAGRVLVIDQFEEIFTLCQSVADKHAYEMNVVNAAVPGNVILLTMRLDYLERLDQLPELRPLFKRGLQLPGALTRTELTDAIVLPAAKAGLKFEDGVVKAIVSDVEREPAALPLLQVMLLRMWEKRERNRVTMATYRMVGGPRALENTAEEFFSTLIPEDQDLVKRILCRMVRPEGELVAVARRVRRNDLRMMAKSPVIVDRILDKLVQAKLVRLTKPESETDAEVELAHEALVRNWGRLRSWIDEVRRSDEDLNRLELRAHEWERLGHGPGGLLDAVSLKMFEKYAEPGEATHLSENARRLLHESKKEIDRQIKQNKLQLTLLMVAAGVFLAVATFAGSKWYEASAARTEAIDATTLAQENLRKANEQEGLTSDALTKATEATALLAEEKKATDTLADALKIKSGALERVNAELAVKGRKFEATELTTLAKAALSEDQNRALLFAIQAARITHDADRAIRDDTRLALQRFVQDQATSFRITTESRVNQASFSPDARHVALAQDNGAVEVWNVFTRKGEAIIKGTKAYAVVYRPDNMLAIGRQDGVQLWNVRDPSQAAMLRQPSPVTGIALGPNGALVTAGSDGRARIFLTNDAFVELPVATSPGGNTGPSTAGGLGAVAWSLNGQLIAAVTGVDAIRTVRTDRWILLWNMNAGKPAFARSIVLPSATLGQERLRGLRFDETGTKIELSTETGRRLYWLTANGESTPPAAEFDAEVDAGPTDFLQDFILGGGTVNGVRRAAVLAETASGWQLAALEDETRRKVLVEQLIQSYVMNVNPEFGVFSDDGNFVLATEDEALEVRDVRTGEILVEKDVDTLTRGALSRDARVIAAAGQGIRIIRPGQPDLSLDEDDMFTSVAVSANGTRVAGSAADAVMLWEVGKSAAIRTWKAQTSTIALSPQGDRLALGNKDGSITLVTPDGAPPRTLAGPRTGEALRLVFDRLGRRIAAAAEDGSVRAWEVASGQILLNQQLPDTVDLRFSGTGEVLAGATSSDGVALWNLSSDKAIQRIKHDASDDLVAVGFSPDSSRLLALDDYGHTLWRESTDAAIISEAMNWLRRGWREDDCEHLKELKCPMPTAVGRAVSAVARGNVLAEQGDRAGALAAYRNAREIDPPLPLDVESQPTRVATIQSPINDIVSALMMRKQARTLARNGEVARAEALYAEAAKLARNPYFDARRTASGDRIERLEDELTSAIKAGRYPEADTLTKEALGLVSADEERIAELVMSAIDAYLDNDRPKDALLVANAARAAITNLDPWKDVWNSICWRGGLEGPATAKEFKEACEIAVKVTDDANTRDSRGLNRALIGDVTGAVSDFEFYIKGSRDEERVAQRQRWVDELKAGRDPFTPEVLKALRVE